MRGAAPALLAALALAAPGWTARAKAATMVDAMVSDGRPATNDEKTYHNGVRIVPSFLVRPLLVDRANWHAALVESGYYKEGQV